MHFCQLSSLSFIIEISLSNVKCGLLRLLKNVMPCIMEVKYSNPIDVDIYYESKPFFLVQIFMMYTKLELFLDIILDIIINSRYS